jgi:hypothetical protein
MVKITITNKFIGITETFICYAIDMSDPNEVDYCISECCGQYLEMHEDVIHNCPDVDFETIAEACEYIVEELNNDESSYF